MERAGREGRRVGAGRSARHGAFHHDLTARPECAGIWLRAFHPFSRCTDFFNWSPPPQDGDTPLSIARRRGRTEIVQLLSMAAASRSSAEAVRALKEAAARRPEHNEYVHLSAHPHSHACSTLVGGNDHVNDHVTAESAPFGPPQCCCDVFCRPRRPATAAICVGVRPEGLRGGQQYDLRHLLGGIFERSSAAL